MSRTQRLEKAKEHNLLTAEFTTGQLVVVICVAMFVAMACFGLGILVARLDPSVETAVALTDEEGDASAEMPEMETYTTPAIAPTSEAPRTGARRTPETPAPRNPYMDNTPRLTALPPLSPQRSSPTEVEAPTRIPRLGSSDPSPALAEEPASENEVTEAVAAPTAPAPEPEPAPAPAPEPAPAPAPTPVLTPITPAEPPVQTAAAVVQQTGPVDGGDFGVQLAAFSGSDRRARAEEFQRHVRTELQVEAAVIPSADDVHYRVIVGGFSTREAATAACAQLRQKSGLKEAFVRPL